MLDQNLSFRLLPRIAPLFPEATHVKNLGLLDALDFDIFQFARRENFVAVLTQDEDFYKILLEHGPPPKVIWLRTAHLAEVLGKNLGLIRQFLGDSSHDCLEIFG